MRHLLISIPLLALSITSQAADNTTVNMRGSLIAPTNCDVIAADTDINLGDIISSKIDDNRYRTDLNVTLTCRDRNSVQAVFVTVTAANAFSNRVPIVGTARGFDLALRRSTTNQDFNNSFRVDRDGTLNLNITPERNTSPFVHGDFTAAITIRVDIV